MPLTTETQTGLAKIFAINAGAYTTLAGACTITINSADLEHQFDTIEDLDQKGNVETILAFKERLIVTMDFYPAGATRAAAITTVVTCKPGMLAKVTLSAFDLAIINGDYNYMGGWSVKTVRDQIVVGNIKLTAHLANRTSLTTAVITG